MNYRWMKFVYFGLHPLIVHRVVLLDVLGGKDVVEGCDGRTDVSDSYRTYSCKNGITSLDSFLHFIPR
jgi:hypothetical protein